MIWFKFWETLYYRKWVGKAGKVLMHPRRFIGFTWNIGDSMTFKVLQCNENPNKRNCFVHRGVVVLRSQTETGYNSALAPKSGSYLPVVQVAGGVNNKTVPLERQGTMDPPNISIP